MMLKNYQEDIVLHVLDIVLENRPELKNDMIFINDVAAYVLNRIPPKYIMSERGFTRLASSQLFNERNEKGIVPLVELVGLINRGIDIVKGRRKTPAEPELFEQPDFRFSASGTLQYLHNFPQVVGRTVDGATRRPVYDACVTLYIDGAKAEPAQPGWMNPYFTNSATEGVYSFWPRATRHHAPTKSSLFTVIIEHRDYRPLSIEREVITEGSFRVYTYIHGNSVVNLDTSRLDRQ